MTSFLCEQLDDFVMQDLAPEIERAFEEHLADCDACRLAVEQSARISRLLKTAANAIVCPPELPARIHRDWPRESRTSWTKAGSLLAAGLVIGLLGWSILSRTPALKDRPKQPVADEASPAPRHVPSVQSQQPQSKIADGKLRQTVRVEFPDEILALPIDTGDPDITLIQLFPVSNVSQTLP